MANDDVLLEQQEPLLFPTLIDSPIAFLPRLISLTTASAALIASGTLYTFSLYGPQVILVLDKLIFFIFLLKLICKKSWHIR
jgi:hypothetical protein